MVVQKGKLGVWVGEWAGGGGHRLEKGGGHMW